MSTTTTADDIRRFREAVTGILGTGRAPATPAPDLEWRARWAALADLGVTALCVPETHGGLGLQAEVATATAMELGAALHGSPFAGLAASGHALAAASSSGQAGEPAAEALAGIMAGTVICAYGRLDAASGIARTVDGAPIAGALLLDDPAAGNLVFLPHSSDWAIATTPHPFDVSRTCADVTVSAGRGHRIPASPTARELFHLLLAADALGGTQRALDTTVAYAKDRQAFGRAIGGFQAVQHRLADHAVRLRGMTLLVQAAAQAVAAHDPDTGRAVLLAEASVTTGAGQILPDLLQLTGAIGFTWEYGLHFFQRRAHQDARLAANPRRAHHALAHLEGWTDGR